MILTLILACEILFWVFVICGLLARYPAHKPRLGAALLLAAPVVDAVLLISVGVDMQRGALATWAHGLAALYIGVSIAFGHSMVRWADVRFAHRFAGGPQPVRLHGIEHTKNSWRNTLRLWLAAAIAIALLTGLIWWVADADRTAALRAMMQTVAVVVVIDLLISVSYTIWPRRAPQSTTTR